MSNSFLRSLIENCLNKLFFDLAQLFYKVSHKDFLYIKIRLFDYIS